MMKCASLLLAALPTAAIAFQNVKPVQLAIQTPGIVTIVDRAKECATLYEFCNIDELETLADEMHKLQGRDHQKVYEILHMQSELKRMMKRYAIGREEDVPDETSEIYWDYSYYHW